MKINLSKKNSPPNKKFQRYPREVPGCLRERSIKMFMKRKMPQMLMSAGLDRHIFVSKEFSQVEKSVRLNISKYDQFSLFLFFPLFSTPFFCFFFPWFSLLSPLSPPPFFPFASLFPPQYPWYSLLSPCFPLTFPQSSSLFFHTQS